MRQDDLDIHSDRPGIDLWKLTAGMLFFGTPHRTRTISGWRSILGRVLGVAQEYNDSLNNSSSSDTRGVGVIQTSEPEDIKLLRDLSSFESLIDKPNLLIYSFYEINESFNRGIPILVRILGR
jgi:hypothetical protein